MQRIDQKIQLLEDSQLIPINGNLFVEFIIRHRTIHLSLWAPQVFHLGGRVYSVIVFVGMELWGHVRNNWATN